MNNDNEKDLQAVNPEDVAEEAENMLREETIEEENTAQDITETEAESCGCGCDCCEGGCCEASEEAENLTYYSEPEAPKKPKIVMPVIVAAVAFLCVAVIVLGGITLYNAFFGTSLKGVWLEQGFEDSGIYFDFDGDGNVYLRGGGISYYGTYETKTIDVDKDTELPEIVTKVSAVEPLSGKVNVLKSDFYLFGMYGGEYIYTLGSENGVKTATLKFVDTSGAVSTWTFEKATLPELKIDPNTVTNASADEAGLKVLKTDKNIIGSWSEADYGTYTFYEDGTANYKTNYQVDQTYSMFYGITMGYGVDLDFKYTVQDGKIYMTVDYYTGESNDGVMSYYLDGKNLVIDGVGYAKTETN